MVRSIFKVTAAVETTEPAGMEVRFQARSARRSAPLFFDGSVAPAKIQLPAPLLNSASWNTVLSLAAFRVTAVVGGTGTIFRMIPLGKPVSGSCRATSVFPLTKGPRADPSQSTAFTTAPTAGTISRPAAAFPKANPASGATITPPRPQTEAAHSAHGGSEGFKVLPVTGLLEVLCTLSVYRNQRRSTDVSGRIVSVGLQFMGAFGSAACVPAKDRR